MRNELSVCAQGLGRYFNGAVPQRSVPRAHRCRRYSRWRSKRPMPGRRLFGLTNKAVRIHGHGENDFCRQCLTKSPMCCGAWQNGVLVKPGDHGELAGTPIGPPLLPTGIFAPWVGRHARGSSSGTAYLATKTPACPSILIIGSSRARCVNPVCTPR